MAVKKTTKKKPAKANDTDIMAGDSEFIETKEVATIINVPVAVPDIVIKDKAWRIKHGIQEG